MFRTDKAGVMNTLNPGNPCPLAGIADCELHALFRRPEIAVPIKNRRAAVLPSPEGLQYKGSWKKCRSPGSLLTMIAAVTTSDALDSARLHGQRSGTLQRGARSMGRLHGLFPQVRAR